MSYVGEPHAIARNTDPETSHEAAASVRDIRLSQRYVYDMLKGGMATDETIYSRLQALGIHMSLSGARTRRKELVGLGLVRDSGARSFTKANRRTILWEVVCAY